MINLLIFLLTISILIFVHELGHFFFARLKGIGVEKFSLGFGHPLVIKKIKDTEFLICLIPLGGYVKLVGDERHLCKGRPDEFYSHSLKDRAQVILGGPLFNFLFAILIFWILFCLGMPALDTVIGEVVADMPAAQAGLQAEDHILSINGQLVNTWDDLQKIIRTSKGELQFVVQRGEKVFTVTMNPVEKKMPDIFGKEHIVPLVGIKPADKVKTLRYNPFKAFFVALDKVGFLSVKMLQGFYYMIIGAVPVRESLAGPIELYRVTGNIFHNAGIMGVILLMVSISISLGIVNLFPIPVLDGGHLFFIGLEALRKRPLTERTEDIVNRMGIAFIILLMFFVLYNDIMRILTNQG